MGMVIRGTDGIASMGLPCAWTAGWLESRGLKPDDVRVHECVIFGENVDMIVLTRDQDESIATPGGATFFRDLCGSGSIAYLPIPPDEATITSAARQAL